MADGAVCGEERDSFDWSELWLRGATLAFVLCVCCGFFCIEVPFQNKAQQYLWGIGNLVNVRCRWAADKMRWRLEKRTVPRGRARDAEGVFKYIHPNYLVCLGFCLLTMYMVGNRFRLGNATRTSVGLSLFRQAIS